MAKHAAFLFHRAFVRNVILPHFTPIGVCVLLIEIAVAGASALPRMRSTKAMEVERGSLFRRSNGEGNH
jgi:hypothetical protein